MILQMGLFLFKTYAWVSRRHRRLQKIQEKKYRGSNKETGRKFRPRPTTLAKKNA